MSEFVRRAYAGADDLARIQALIFSGKRANTYERLMKRTNISKRIETERVVVEFDEEYQAESMVTTNSHFLDEFGMCQ